MNNEKKDLIFKRNKDLLALINFSGGWMFQAQLQEFALKMGYTSITMFRNELIKLENEGIIKKESWNGKNNIIKLRNFALVKFQNQKNNSKPTSVRIPTHYSKLAFRIAKNEQMIFLLNRVYNQSLSFEQIRQMPFRFSFDTLFINPIERADWIRNLNKQKALYINQKFFIFAYQNTLQGVFNSNKGLKNIEKKLEKIKAEINPAIQYDHTYDIFKILGTNMYIDSMLFKEKVVKITVSYITTNEFQLKNIVDRFEKIDIYFSQLFNADIKIITDYRIVTTKLNTRKLIEQSLKNLRLYIPIKVLNNSVEKKYDLKLKYPPLLK